MVVLSKPIPVPFHLAWNEKLACSCYEAGHTWNPSCLGTIGNVLKHGFIFSSKIYFPLYLLTTLLRCRNKKYRNRRTFFTYLRNALQSSVFLASNAGTFMAFFCLIGKLFGGYYGSFGLLVGICCCTSSIFIERKERRSLLALYLLNIATEAIYTMLKSRNIISTFKNFEVYLFGASSAALMLLYKQSGLPASIQSSVKWLIGDESSSPTVSNHSQKHNQMYEILQVLQRYINIGPKSRYCKHPLSCLGNSLKTGLRQFLLGYLLQLVLNLRIVFTKYFNGKTVPRSLFLDFNLAKFVGGFTFIFQILRCILRKQFDGKNEGITHAISGFFAGLCSYFYKSTSISLYLFYKLLEILYFKGIEAGKLPYIYHGDAIIYICSMATLFHVVVMEPHNMRPAYYKFLVGLSHGKFTEMFRLVLDVFGTKASTLHPSFIPALDMKHVHHPLVKDMMSRYGHLAVKSSIS